MVPALQVPHALQHRLEIAAHRVPVAYIVVPVAVVVADALQQVALLMHHGSVALIAT